MSWEPLKTAPAPVKKRKNGRAKGQRGEREVAKLFIDCFQRIGRDDLADEVKRNTLQSDRGGFDLVGTPYLAPEVKFCAPKALGATANAGWTQCVRQAKTNLFPVLFYRCNNMPWRVRSYVSLQFPQTGNTMRWIVADYTTEAFFDWYGALIARDVVPGLHY